MLSHLTEHIHIVLFHYLRMDRTLNHFYLHNSVRFALLIEGKIALSK
jgi:hypothetical protein